MRRKWIPIGMVAGLVAMAITGGTLLASGGDSGGDDPRPSTEVAVQQPDEFTTRIAEIIGVDPKAVADAMAEVDAALEAEYVEALLRQAVDKGHITTEQADAIRAQVQSGDYSELDRLWLDGIGEGDEDGWFVEPEGVSHLEYSNRVGAILNVDGQKVADAIGEAADAYLVFEEDGVEGSDEFTTRIAEIIGVDPKAVADAMAQVDAALGAEYVEALLRQAVDKGHITTEQADAIRAQVQSGDYSEFDRLCLDGIGEGDGDGWFVEPEGVSHQEYSNRVGAILNVDGQKVADAIDQALEELNSMDQEIIWDNTMIEDYEEWDEAAEESRPEPSTPVAAGR